jgi:hypothetical protein
MKALVTAFALLSFVAATTIPYAASAQTSAPTTHTHKMTHAKKKHVKKVSTTHKKTTKKTKKPATA